jgi:tRNA threonylcarbamoyladenosine biosynthesis protein TsaE
MEITALSTQETKELAEAIAKKIRPKTVLALHGDLGTGKTTFTSFLVKALGMDSRVQSPTFVLIRKYSKKAGQSNVISAKNAENTIDTENSKKNVYSNLKVYHIDLYRLTNISEVVDLGLEDVLSEENAIFVIEWPEIAEELLPENTIHIYFENFGEDGRKINVQNLA